jgi:hypothetical protein
MLAQCFRLSSQGRSNWVKPVSAGQTGGRNPCKPMPMNNLQNKRLWSGQTSVNLVNGGQKEPVRLKHWISDGPDGMN